MDLRGEIERLIQPYQDQLSSCYADGGEDGKFDHDRIRKEMWDEVGEKMECLGFIDGVIIYGGLTRILDDIYFMPFTPLSDGKTWVLCSLKFGGVEGRWHFDWCGCVTQEGLSMAEAAYFLLKQHATPGSDRQSKDGYEDLLEEWRCRSLGLPVPAWSRRAARFINRVQAQEDAAFPDRPSVFDAEYTERELIFVVHALAMMAKSDGSLHENESRLLDRIVRDLSIDPAYAKQVLDGMTTEATPLAMIQILGGAEGMREAKKVRLAQFMFFLMGADGVSTDHQERIFATICSAIGLVNEDGWVIDPFSDFEPANKAQDDLETLWSYSPSWPFMPGAVEVLSHEDEDFPVVALREGGALIVWMKLEGQAPRLDLRLSYGNDKFRMSAFLSGVSRPNWTRELDVAPNVADILLFLSSPSHSGVMRRVEADSPLGELLGGKMEIRDWKPVVEGRGTTRRVEFDCETNVTRERGPGYTPDKYRRSLHFSSDFHLAPGAMESFLKGEIPNRYRA